MRESLLTVRNTGMGVEFREIILERKGSIGRIRLMGIGLNMMASLRVGALYTEGKIMVFRHKKIMKKVQLHFI